MQASDRLEMKMKEKTFDKELRCRIAAMALGMVDAIEAGVLDPFSAQKMLFSPGIYEKYKDDPDLYRLLNLGEELETVIYHMSAEAVERSVKEIKDLCYRILSDAPKVKVIRI